MYTPIKDYLSYELNEILTDPLIGEIRGMLLGVADADGYRDLCGNNAQLLSFPVSFNSGESNPKFVIQQQAQRNSKYGGGDLGSFNGGSGGDLAASYSHMSGSHSANQQQQQLLYLASSGNGQSKKSHTTISLQQKRQQRKVTRLFHNLLNLLAPLIDIPDLIGLHFMYALAYFLPILHAVLPWAVPGRLRQYQLPPNVHCTPVSSSSRLIGGSHPELLHNNDSNRSLMVPLEVVTEISFHPTAALIAVVLTRHRPEHTQEGGGLTSLYSLPSDNPHNASRIAIYYLESRKNIKVADLAHAFQQNVSCVAWKPNTDHILVAGVEGGVLVWNLTVLAVENKLPDILHPKKALSNVPPELVAAEVSRINFNLTAGATFYRTVRHTLTTSLTFLHPTKEEEASQARRYPLNHPPQQQRRSDGHTLLCATRAHTQVIVLDLKANCADTEKAIRQKITPSLDGGVEWVQLIQNNQILMSGTASHPSIVFTYHWDRAPTTRTVCTPSPVLEAVPARPPDTDTFTSSDLFFFLRLRDTEGVVLARANPTAKSLQIMTIIATPLYQGVGGAVQRLTASAERVYLLTETGHLVVCGYGYAEGCLALKTVGIAAVGQLNGLRAMQYGGNCGLLAMADTEGVVKVIASNNAYRGFK